MFDLQPYLTKKRATIDKALDGMLPCEDETPRLLHKAMRYSVLSGGKRLRPILCLAASEASGAPAEVALYPAVAVELLHTYTLIHDDLPCMDDDDLRRNKPASHIVFGEANAILAGDALQALAFEVLSRATVPPSFAPMQLVTELALAAGNRGVVGGQVEDLAASQQAPTADQIHFIHLHKTASLFRASVRMGAITGNADSSELKALTDYATNLGLAFQIADDLLDGAPSEDKKKGATCLAVYDRSAAEKAAREWMEKASRALDSLKRGPTEALLEIARFTIERDI